MQREKGELGPTASSSLLLVFGALTVVLIGVLDAPSVGRLDLLLQAGGLGLFGTALLWFFLLAMQRGAAWSLAMLIPYVNLLAASTFARRYWSQGARAPALVGLLGMVLQTVASLRMLAPALPTLV